MLCCCRSRALFGKPEQGIGHLAGVMETIVTGDNKNPNVRYCTTYCCKGASGVCACPWALSCSLLASQVKRTKQHRTLDVPASSRKWSAVDHNMPYGNVSAHPKETSWCAAMSDSSVRHGVVHYRYSFPYAHVHTHDYCTRCIRQKGLSCVSMPNKACVDIA